MTNYNLHVESYLKHYCFQIDNPGFAVLLKGDWGSGKTWFIHDFMQKNDEEKFLYLSLYGLNNVSQIDDLIFEKIHPILSSKSVLLVSKVIQSALRLGFEIDINDGKSSKIRGNTEIPKIALKDFIKKISFKIIVFDDLERNNIDPVSLLGYINTFIEQQKLKVILIGDEQKLIKKAANEYADAKEKIIGQTFNILPISKNALTKFIFEINDKDCRNFLSIIEEPILELFTKLNYKNLRDLRQSLLGFEYLYKNIDGEYKRENEYIQYLFLVYCYLSLELKANLIDQNNWQEAFELFFYKNISQKEFKMLSDEEKTKIKQTAAFNLVFNRYNVPLGNSMSDIILHGIIDKTAINDSIKNSQYFKSKNKTTLNELLASWTGIDNKTFKEKYELLNKELKRNKYTHPAEILHLAGLLLSFSKYNLIPLKKEEIIELVTSYIGRLSLLNKLQKFEFKYDYPPEDFSGFGFNSRDAEEFQLIYKKLKGVTSSQRKSNLKMDVISCINSFPKSYKEFMHSLIYISVEGKFSQDPVLSWIDPKEFLNKYLQVPNDSKPSFIYALEDRYEKKYSNGVLREHFFDEKTFLIEFKHLIDKKINQEEFLFNVDNFVLKRISSELNEIIEYFKKQVELKKLSVNTD